MNPRYDSRMRFGELVSASKAVAETNGRLAKIGHLSAYLKRLSQDEIEIAVEFLSGSPRQGRIGVGWSTLGALRDVVPAESATLELRDVDEAFERAAAASGAGSNAARSQILRDVLRRATYDEQDFIVRLLFGELRQGALEGVLVEAVARAADVSSTRLRRAAMMAGALAPVARAALTDGDAALARFIIQPGLPVQPMLAQSAETVEEAIQDLGEVSLEYKLDGARIQVHKSNDDVRVFSRNLRDVTVAVPEIVEIVAALPAREIILDGEVMAFRNDGMPLPFQVTMRRFGRKLDVEAQRRELPLTPAFFDALYLDGQAILDEPLTNRMAAIERIVPVQWRVPRIVTARPDEALAFQERSIASGHEGVMAKATGGTYAAGRRGQAWIKVKRARTLDLVVLAAEWGHGRRKGTLSNLHLGARNLAGGFVMLGKTFKGMTDEMLAWQTKKFLELETARDAYTVYLRPELVVEVAFNEIQESQYPGGLALRFARVKRYRPDKSAADADTIATVRALYEQMTNSGG
jgi:ATP-dependent DNA ligase I